VAELEVVVVLVVVLVEVVEVVLVVGQDMVEALELEEG
jgi:hypothetical protein